MLADLLVRKVNDPRLRDARIVEVRMSPDLREATVFFSVFPADAARESEAAAGFTSAASLFRREIGRHLKLRATPDLHFRADHTAGYAAHIEKLLSEEAQELGLTDQPVVPADSPDRDR